MSNVAKLEQELLALPAAEREQLALKAWESLGDGSNPTVVASRDPEGIEIARRRDSEISEGSKDPISHEEFLRQTSGGE